MRIAIWHDLPSGGGKRALYDQVQGLMGRGHYLESWCPPTADQEFLPLDNLVVEHVVAMDIFEPTWRAMVGRLSGGATQTLARLNAMDRHSRHCAAEIDDGNFDVVLAGSSGPLAVTGLATYLGTPAVLYLQEPFRPLYEATPVLPWPALAKSQSFNLFDFRKRVFNAAQVRALRIQAREELKGVQAYARVLANSYFSRESMLRAYGIEAAVCYLGVDTERYRDLRLPRQRLVVGIGAFFPNKRVEVVIEAIARISRSRPPLVWIGNSARESYLEGLVHLAERRNVSFTPLVAASHDDVVRLLNEASVLAYAPRLEPLGFAPLEAGACCLPVVAKAEGGVRETVVTGETGLLVDEDADLTGALECLLDDPPLARRMGTAGRLRVESTWSLPQAIARLEAQLLDVIQDSNPFDTKIPDLG
jgi:glycosyltransferase involved in cell wall biosynthesis